MTSLSETSMLAGAAGQSTGYTIDQSIRFNSADSGYMHRTPSSTGNRKKFTSSFWVKFGDLTDCALPMPSVAQSASYGAYLASGIIQFFIYYTGSAWQGQLYTNRVFRDPSAWYHFVIVVDTTQAVAQERVRIYINGSRELSFSTENYPNQNQDTDWNNSSEKMGIGINANSFSGSHGEFYAAEMHYLDGYAYGPEYFGEFNSNGIWIPIEYTGSYGTNGFYIDGRDSGDLGDDESGQGNDFTTSGLAAHDQVLDSPTNNFCVMSSIDFTYNAIRNGNLETIGGNNNKGGRGTMGFSSGKFYWEMLATTVSDGYPGSGVVYDSYASSMPTAYAGGGTNYGSGASHNQANWYKQSTSGTAYGSTASSGDILQYAVDRDNNKIYWGVNGTYRNSGDPAGGTGAVASSLTHRGDWMPFVSHGSNAGTSAGTFNFGQDGTFAGAKTAQGNSDGNGVGNFYYSPPSGFLALCSKNLGS